MTTVDKRGLANSHIYVGSEETGKARRLNLNEEVHIVGEELVEACDCQGGGTMMKYILEIDGVHYISSDHDIRILDPAAPPEEVLGTAMEEYMKNTEKPYGVGLDDPAKC